MYVPQSSTAVGFSWGTMALCVPRIVCFLNITFQKSFKNLKRTKVIESLIFSLFFFYTTMGIARKFSPTLFTAFSSLIGPASVVWFDFLQLSFLCGCVCPENFVIYQQTVAAHLMRTHLYLFCGHIQVKTVPFKENFSLLRCQLNILRFSA